MPIKTSHGVAIYMLKNSYVHCSPHDNPSRQCTGAPAILDEVALPLLQGLTWNSKGCSCS